MTYTPNGVRKKILLLLDTGDNCRCPMAEGYLKKLLAERGIDWVEVKTAGVMTPTGVLPAPEAVSLLKEENVDIARHKSRPMKLPMLEEADLVLGFSSLHVQRAIRDGGDAVRGKTHLLKEYVGFSGKDVQIPDPIGGTMDTFKRVFEQIKIALEKLVETDFIKTPPEGWFEQQRRAAAEEEQEATETAHVEDGETSPQRAPQEEKESTAVEPTPKRGRRKKVSESEPTAQAAEKPKRGRPRNSESKETAVSRAKGVEKESASASKTRKKTTSRTKTVDEKPPSKKVTTPKSTTPARTPKKQTAKSKAEKKPKAPKAQTPKKETGDAGRRKRK